MKGKRKTIHVAWFSAGVSSAVATKLAIKDIERVYYIHIEDHHPDTKRFVSDCEAWFQKPIETMQSPYKTVENAIRAAGGRGYINGPRGAACSLWLKKRVRKEWEIAHEHDDIVYYWGFDVTEKKRAERLVKTSPNQSHRFPLIENNITKENAHQILKASGISRPAMYDLGYHNNNCVGCVKGGMGYWNKIRCDFPSVFEKMAKLERVVGASCINGVFLDELDNNRGCHSGPICEECDILCEAIKI